MTDVNLMFTGLDVILVVVGSMFVFFMGLLYLKKIQLMRRIALGICGAGLLFPLYFFGKQIYKSFLINDFKTAVIFCAIFLFFVFLFYAATIGHKRKYQSIYKGNDNKMHNSRDAKRLYDLVLRDNDEYHNKFKNIKIINPEIVKEEYEKLEKIAKNDDVLQKGKQFLKEHFEFFETETYRKDIVMKILFELYSIKNGNNKETILKNYEKKPYNTFIKKFIEYYEVYLFNKIPGGFIAEEISSQEKK